MYVCVRVCAGVYVSESETRPDSSQSSAEWDQDPWCREEGPGKDIGLLLEGER